MATVTKAQTCCKCSAQVSSLYHVRGIPGEFCEDCKPPAHKWNDPWAEDVRGTVIGSMAPRRYEFWTTDGSRRIVKAYGDDGDDSASAIAWFQANYPAEFNAGVIMREYDD